MKHATLLTKLALSLLLFCLTAAARETGNWRAASKTAYSITGDISIASEKILINFTRFPSSRIRTLEPAEVSAVFDADANTAGTGSLGRPRWIGVADWRGAPVVREVKVILASAWPPGRPCTGAEQAMRNDAAARGKYRANDPLHHALTGVAARDHHAVVFAEQRRHSFQGLLVRDTGQDHLRPEQRQEPVGRLPPPVTSLREVLQGGEKRESLPAAF